MKNQIVLNEQDLHFLVEDAVKNYLVENGLEETVWGGMKNAFQGIRKGNWNLSNIYGAGDLASSFNKYYGQAKNGLDGMVKIASKYDNGGQLSASLANANKMIATVANSFNMQAKRVALNRKQSDMSVINPWKQQQTQGQKQPQGQQQTPREYLGIR